jgi:co-chaperonin GroES (HSP10)
MMDKTRIELSLSNFRVLRDKIMAAEMDFDERVTASGIILPSDDMEQRGIRPRWCRVIAVGPDQTEAEVGKWIYVAHGRWSRGIDCVDTDTGDQFTIRQIDPAEILLMADEPIRDETVREKIGLNGGV